jgi:hypothetical protein
MRMLRSPVVLAAASLALLLGGPASAADDALKGDAPTNEVRTNEAPKAEAPKPKNYFVQSLGYGTRPEQEPPRYARRLSEVGIEQLKDLDWLIAGLDFRTRFEYRSHDYRRDLITDRPFLFRTRAYLGIERLLDPLRLGFEFQDSQWANSDWPDTPRDVDVADVLQGFLELYFKDLVGPRKTVRLQAGRMAFEYLDRRLISRNPWRNTTNAFQGFRLMVGEKDSDWWVDVLAVQPVLIRPHQPDERDKQRWLWGFLSSWQRWSEIVTLQPYFLVLDSTVNPPESGKRNIYTMGLRGYGIIGKTGFDYDVDMAGQIGTRGPRTQGAVATAAELGYTIDMPWKPRVSGFFGYASGDESPGGAGTERFNRLFGFARPWSASDYFIWENLIAPKARIEAYPHPDVTCEAGYSSYWLASDTDAWPNAFPVRRDQTGGAGSFIGQEIDLRLRWRVDPRVELIGGYAFFWPGSFTERTGPAPDSNFLYLELNLQLWK